MNNTSRETISIDVRSLNMETAYQLVRQNKDVILVADGIKENNKLMPNEES